MLKTNAQLVLQLGDVEQQLNTLTDQILLTQPTELSESSSGLPVLNLEQQLQRYPLVYNKAVVLCQLALASQNQQEQAYFLQQASGSLEFELVQVELEYWQFNFNVLLAVVYVQTYMLLHYQLTNTVNQSPIKPEASGWLKMAEQLLKGMAALNFKDVLFLLAKVNALQGNVALCQHWLAKMLKLPAINTTTDLIIEAETHALIWHDDTTEQWWQDEAFAQVKALPWFVDIVSKVTH